MKPSWSTATLKRFRPTTTPRTVFADDLLSAVYIGWTRGYLDDERGRFEQALQDGGLLAPFRGQIQIAHPRVAFQAMAAALAAPGHEGWLD